MGIDEDRGTGRDTRGVVYGCVPIKCILALAWCWDKEVTKATNPAPPPPNGFLVTGQDSYGRSVHKGVGNLSPFGSPCLCPTRVPFPAAM